MIEDPVSEEIRKYGRLATAEDYYTKEEIEKMRETLMKGNWAIKKDEYGKFEINGN